MKIYKDDMTIECSTNEFLEIKDDCLTLKKKKHLRVKIHCLIISTALLINGTRACTVVRIMIKKGENKK